MFSVNPFSKKPFSNGSGNPAITYGYNINNYNNPFGNPSTSLGLEGSVTLPNYQNVFSYDLAAAFTAAQQNGSLQSNAVILDPGNISGPVSSERAKEISDSSQELIKNTFSQKQIQAMLGNTVTEERAKQIANLAQLAIPETVNKIKKSPIKPSFSEKFSNSTFGKDFDKWSQGLNIANNLFTTFAGEKSEYGGTKGGLIRGIDSVYDTAQSAAAMFGSIGQFASLLMGGNKLLGNVANKLGAGTDGRTTTDAILNSSFLQLTPFGMINGFGGKKTMSFTKNNLAFAQVGSGYTGTNAKVNKAVDLADKKFGLSSLGALDEANDKIIDAGGEQRIMANVADTASDRFALSDSMAAINNSRMALNLMGDYDQSSVRVGRHGMIIQNLQKAKEITSLLKYQDGGKVTDPFEYYLQTLPKYQRDSSNFRVKDYWEFNGKPKDFNEAISRGMFIQLEGEWHAKSVAENPKTGEIEFMKSPSHPSIQKELDWYNSNDASEFRSQYELQKTKPYFKYVKRKNKIESQQAGGNIGQSVWFSAEAFNGPNAEYLAQRINSGQFDDIDAEMARAGEQNQMYYREGGILQEVINIPTEFLEVPEFKEGGQIPQNYEILKEVTEIPAEFLEIDEFKRGGKFNIIPEGALHARKHNMDVENITQKGIPVVSESADGEIVQQAEIERQEIIFRLEVTKKLEELAKDDSDEAAIEAGKLLVQEILYNTIDNTNTLL